MTGRLVPVDSKSLDWPRKVANAINALQSETEFATGWGAYNHTGSTQALTASTKATLVNNAGSKIESQKPSDIDTFYDGSVITGRNGDGISVRLELTFTPDDGTASYFWVAVDIGSGSPIEIYPSRFEITGGALVAHQISYSFPGYTLSTWEANGGAVKVLSDGPGVVSDVVYVIHRLHKAN